MKKKNGDELLTAKAYNGRVIMSWLSDTLLVALAQHPDHETLLLTSSAMKLGPRSMLIVVCCKGQ